MKFTFRSAFFIFLFGIQGVVAQKKDENIGTEVVNVVKPYTPTISDAFKVKETPPLEDEDNTKKNDIKYNIFSFPVASTFTPSKGRAANVDKEARERLYKNFATVGLGLYGTANAELFVTEEVGDNGFVAGMLRHLSSAGGIDNVELEDGFSDSSIDLTYGNKQRELSWNFDLGYQNQGYNWYGLPEGFGSTLIPEEREDLVNAVEPQHFYHNAYASTKFDFNEMMFSSVSAKYNRFWDSYGSEENRFFVKPELNFEVAETNINVKLIVDYVGGSFDNDYFFTGESIKYGYTNIGIHPSFNWVRDDWSVNFGAATFLSFDLETSDNKFFIYPQVNASYKLIGDLMIFYAGAEGTMEQNTYRDFTNENPYVSPTLYITPTDRQFDIFAGLKGKLANSVSYNLRGSYINERNRALFRSNDYTENAFNEEFAFGNSFSVVYDDMKTISFFGELKADFSKNVSFGVNGTFSSYSTDIQEEAWNLPAIKVGSSLDVNITKKWYAGANVFFVGERKDVQDNLDTAETEPVQTLESYFDANAHVGYKHNERLTGFLRFNNIANQDYQRWLNYPVQGFQVILGASYKFDF
ncbi:MAG TPA: TonB-dependent receptor [Flavobacterium sp.]|jgi:outer membrane receptor protein involved in Fe transport